MIDLTKHKGVISLGDEHRGDGGALDLFAPYEAAYILWRKSLPEDWVVIHKGDTWEWFMFTPEETYNRYKGLIGMERQLGDIFLLGNHEELEPNGLEDLYGTDNVSFMAEVGGVVYLHGHRMPAPYQNIIGDAGQDSKVEYEIVKGMMKVYRANPTSELLIQIRQVIDEFHRTNKFLLAAFDKIIAWPKISFAHSHKKTHCLEYTSGAERINSGALFETMSFAMHDLTTGETRLGQIG
jgi:hypothetical protein